MVLAHVRDIAIDRVGGRIHRALCGDHKSCHAGLSTTTGQTHCCREWHVSVAAAVLGSWALRLRSVPQDPQALRVALAHVAPAVDPSAGGEERFAAAEDGTAR